MYLCASTNNTSAATLPLLLQRGMASPGSAPAHNIVPFSIHLPCNVTPDRPPTRAHVPTTPGTHPLLLWDHASIFIALLSLHVLMRAAVPPRSHFACHLATTPPYHTELPH